MFCSSSKSRLLLSLAISKKCIPKQGDVSQAFVKLTLPDNEQYVRPPPGCPLSKRKHYLRLIKTLYGLKRSPRHWYRKAKQVFLSLGLRHLPNSSSIFTGDILPGQPPIFIGLYVDDFIYFSESSRVEKFFETQFGNQIKTSFNGPLSHFLGISFSHSSDKNKKLFALLRNT